MGYLWRIQTNFVYDSMRYIVLNNYILQTHLPQLFLKLENLIFKINTGIRGTYTDGLKLTEAIVFS